METTFRMAHDGICKRYGHVTAAAPSLYESSIEVTVRGTSLGPVLVSRAVQMWVGNVSAGRIADIIHDVYDTGLGRTAVQNALAGADETLHAKSDEISESWGNAPNPKADETSYRLLHRNGYV